MNESFGSSSQLAFYHCCSSARRMKTRRNENVNKEMNWKERKTRWKGVGNMNRKGIRRYKPQWIFLYKLLFLCIHREIRINITHIHSQKKIKEEGRQKKVREKNVWTICSFAVTLPFSCCVATQILVQLRMYVVAWVERILSQLCL